MKQPKKLIEVAMPVKEISAESVQDKYIHHGHISTLHIWWARRPLPICRAVVFASLVPDPLDENCPQQFKDAVKQLLGKPFAIKSGDAKMDWYKPYDDIPHTAAIDPMKDNLRNRLLMFIGKFSDQYVLNERMGKATPAKDKLSDASLIKWDNKNNETILNIARKLIWVSHDPEKNTTLEFEKQWNAIKKTENELYATLDRHTLTNNIKQKEEEKEKAFETFLNRMPIVFDPFAGGGAIPLEASRLGCRSYGNDLNPVAHIIQKGSLEFCQKYGKPIIYSLYEFNKIYGKEAQSLIEHVDKKLSKKGELLGIQISNRLKFDVDYWAKKLIQNCERKANNLYPQDEDGNKPVVYYWVKVAKCENPSCGNEVPLLKQFYLKKKGMDSIYLNPIIKENTIDFEISHGEPNIEGWINRGHLNCPFCGQTTEKNKVKNQFINNSIKDRLIVEIYDNGNGKEYVLAHEISEKAALDIVLESSEIPVEKMQRNSAGGDTFSWGINRWAQLFNKRQLKVLNIFVKELEKIKIELKIFDDEYKKVINANQG